MLDKSAVARALREIGALLQIQGENPFKVRAYESGARALEEAPEALPALVASGRLTDLQGIGEALARKIADLHLTGRTPLLDRLRAEVPPGVLELSQVPDLGPRKLAALRTALGISSPEELEAACRAGRVRALKGFGARTEQRLLEGLARRGASRHRVLLSEALELAEPLREHLASGPAERVDLAGSARRGKETVSSVRMLAATRRPAELDGWLASTSGAVSGPGPNGSTKGAGTNGAATPPGATVLRLGGRLPVELRTAPPEEHAAALLHLTGSSAHLARLHRRAAERGLDLSPRGLARIGGEPVPASTEEQLYRALGLPFIPPELREDQGEIEAALQGTLPSDLVELSDVRGAVHCHTRWSDGRATIAELARAADALGLEYLTITDHSASAHYAGGLDADRLRAQWDEIARVQEGVRVRLLRGTESDVTEDGALDFPDAVLEQLDVVVASVHARFGMDEDAMTRRLVRAMKLPVFKIWGHARGRLLLEREPFPCRVEEVLDALATSRGAVEVNGDPHRLELDPAGLRLARERGVPVVLSVDAHATSSLRFLRYAVATARRGWVRRAEVLNTRGVEEFRAAVKPFVRARGVPDL